MKRLTLLVKAVAIGMTALVSFLSALHSLPTLHKDLSKQIAWLHDRLSPQTATLIGGLVLALALTALLMELHTRGTAPRKPVLAMSMLWLISSLGLIIVPATQVQTNVPELGRSPNHPASEGRNAAEHKGRPKGNRADGSESRTTSKRISDNAETGVANDAPSAEVSSTPSSPTESCACSSTPSTSSPPTKSPCTCSPAPSTTRPAAPNKAGTGEPTGFEEEEFEFEEEPEFEEEF